MDTQTQDPSAAPAATRRGFLQAGGALVIGFVLPASGRAAVKAAAADAVPISAYLRIAPDNRITVVCGASEMGQGVLTAIPMLLAEELDADWSLVGVEQAPADKAYANPMFGMQATGGSATVRGNWTPMREAGAAARAMLVAAAAERWKVDAAQLRTERSFVLGPGGRKASYGSLAAAAARQSVPAKPALKQARDFKLLGQPLHRLDTPSKVDGSARFGIDAQVRGLWVAVMARAPAPGAKPLKLDEAAARAVKGVRQVLTIPSGVAVLADGFWAAKKGRDALQVQWDLGPAAQLSSAAVSTMLDEAAGNADAVARDEGNVRDAAANASATVQARYEVPYLAHACMEPMNCTAWVRGDEVEIWAGTQSQGPAQGILGAVAQVAPARVQVHTLMLGGGFGRRFAPDFTVDATLLSKLSGKPVKLIYTREDDMAAGYYRPASVVRFEAATDAQGRPTVLRAGVGSPSIMAASGFLKIPASGVDSMAVEGLADHPYDIPNQRIAYGRAEPGPQVWFWRSVGHSQNAFFIESFIDELAAAAHQDPFEYRRALLGKSPRHKAVLERAAAEAGWGRPLPAGRARGIAVAESFGSYVAEVAEVSVDADGTPRVHRVVAAVDCGQTVNPAIVQRQIESAIVFGLSAALYGRISYAEGRVEQGNFNTYPVLRMNAAPKVEVHVMASTEAPGGIGEPGTPPLAPAVLNAIYAATGRRLRKLPVDTAALRKA
ncbi:MAG: xanthine dehydrogenase family protein molybdopterin-binding subunit [Burkholderiales bacterium]|nr:xanthine dehydrogenase family protein molybdopterin-binding subunit [Burkholderiales bacterium]